MLRFQFSVLILLLGISTYTIGSTKPNIIIIIADDLGWNDVSFHGSEIKTPHIDNLAKEGIALNLIHIAPVSTPTQIG